MKKLVILTGAGMSAESGIKTFRDSGGLWEEYDVMEVASIEGWYQNKELVLRFYNERRKQLEHAQPNAGHTGLVALEKHFDVQIITQNVDNLHERAGSKNVLHLHGILTQAKSTGIAETVYDIGYKEINMGDTCERGCQLRPNIVWFGEAVPEIANASALVEQADILAIIGTSLNVYPAAGLVSYAPNKAPIFLIDPNPVVAASNRNIEFIKDIASEGVQKLTSILIEKYL